MIQRLKKTYSEIDESIIDFYSTYDPLEVDALDKEEYNKYLNSLDPEMKNQLGSDKNYYEIEIEKLGGLIMPVILQFEYVDGTKEDIRIPAEIWKLKPDNAVTKVFPTDKEIKQITLDPYLETADIDTGNNYFPPRPEEASRFELFKGRQRFGPGGENPMQRANRAKKIIKP